MIEDFTLDDRELKRIADEFGASKETLRYAYSRAMRRTAQTMKARARKELRTELQMRSAAEIRKRLFGFKFKRGKYDWGEFRMWFGLNDMRVSAFKGRAKSTSTGATFAGQEFERAFVGRNRKGKQTIMQRASRKRWPIKEARMPIESKARYRIQDLLDDFEEVFFKNFYSEVRSRTLYQVGELD